MIQEFLFVHMLFLPFIYGANNTVQNTQNINDTVLLPDILSNKTNNILVTEGGAITNINSNVTLQYDKSTELAMDKELGTSKNTSSVKARKGVLSDEFADSTAVNSTDVNDHQIISNNKVNNNTNLIKNHAKLSNNTGVNSSIAEVVKTTVIPHKPAVLVYEDLSGLNHKVQSQAVPSSKTVVSDQIPNPVDDLKTIEGNQPGMIMPVVITILTAPLLVVLGYMALTRGREAWKNRHYKRMDFLLDGMYND